MGQIKKKVMAHYHVNSLLSDLLSSFF